MGLNYDIAVVLYDEDDNAIKNAKVHAFFNKVNGSSSDSKWNEDIQKTSGTGKTSFNLGDDSFLTSNGKIDNGDTVLITAWLSDNSDTSNDDKKSKNPDTLTRCVNLIHTVDTSSSSYEEKIILLRIKAPICNFTIPEVHLTGHEFSIQNDSSISTGAFSVQTDNVTRDDLYQETSHYSEDLFIGLAIKETEYDLGEVQETVTGIGDYTYTYIHAGDYDCAFKVKDFLGFYCESTKNYHILYNEPTIDFDFTFTKLLNTDKHIGVGDDDEMKTEQKSHTNFNDTWDLLNATFDWYVYDLNQDGSDNADSYNGKDEDFEPTKLYHCSTDDEPKNLKLTIHWNDGFDDQTLEKILEPVLHEYSIEQDIHWVTQKEYQKNGIYIPLGDDDKVTIFNDNTDNAPQDYDSNSQWKKLIYTASKKKNDGSDDTETLTLTKDNDDYLKHFEYFVKFYHTSDDYASINQEIQYWDGFKDVTKNILKNYVTEKYSITQNFHWETSLHGRNKNVVNDADEVTIFNDSVYGPQDNQDVTTNDSYDITKDRYTSYTDDTVIADNENFSYDDDNLENHPSFYVKKDGNFNILNTITYYDGYDSVTSTKTLTVTASVMTPHTIFDWYGNEGKNGIVIGRDDEITFKNSSFLTDYYDKEYSKTGSRNLSIDWYMKNYITKGNFSNPDVIGGDTFQDSDDNTNTFMDQGMTDEPTLHYWSSKTGNEAQSVNVIFHYNDGYFNRDDSLEKFIKSEPYENLVPRCTYTASVPDRDTTITFVDNSTTNENRIIDEDWSLTDRYEDLSMTEDKRGQDNKQVWLNVTRETSTDTTVNSHENHTLSQDIIRWDNGFKEQTFTNQYTISTTAYTINPSFSYSQEFVTGPEIIFKNESTVNDSAKMLEYDYEIEDKDNDGNDAFAAYRDIPWGTKEQKHTYKSVSNSPHEDDVHNKNVTIFQDFDDGWNHVYDSYDMDILVKPNRISQDFTLEPLRHGSDTETEVNVITGNNPMKFYDNSTTQRTDTNFIKKVQYIITEDC